MRIEKYGIINIFVIIFSPIFLIVWPYFSIYSLDTYINSDGLIVIPVSAFVVALIGIRYLINSLLKQFIIYFALILYLGLAYYINAPSRFYICFFELMFFFMCFFGFKDYLSRHFQSFNELNICITKSLYFTVLIKLVFDFFVWNNMFSKYFLTELFSIRNYYEYFVVLYLITFSIAVDNFFKRKYSFISALVIFVCVFCVLKSYSDIAKIILIMSCLLYLFSRVIKFSASIYIIIMFITMMLIMLVTVTNYEVLSLLNKSAEVRFGHWTKFFEKFQFTDTLWPINNTYRRELNGSMHNELLEIYSLLGVFGLFIYSLVFYFLSKANTNLLFFMILLIISIGGMVQLNMLHIYSGILLSFSLAFLLYQSKKENF
ncbi:hypothetical protein [Zooshikella ganghwensis]|uniref:hypothetical protein n=1 Tax=Zooshikella ganghwensis TaxID=202772 RepID=UPI00040EC168|nr:hypothetical protein [Zooshikella ganghwensis]